MWIMWSFHSCNCDFKTPAPFRKKENRFKLKNASSAALNHYFIEICGTKCFPSRKCIRVMGKVWGVKAELLMWKGPPSAFTWLGRGWSRLVGEVSETWPHFLQDISNPSGWHLWKVYSPVKTLMLKFWVRETDDPDYLKTDKILT